MGFTEDIRETLKGLIGDGRQFANRKRMADSLEIDPSQLNRFLSGDRGLTVDSLGHILDRLGAEVRLPGGRPGIRPVRFGEPAAGEQDPGADALRMDTDDYVAVPLVRPLALPVGPIPDEAVFSWMLLWRGHPGARGRSDLMLVELDDGDQGMVPLLHPGDLVLVDRSELDPDPGGAIMLVADPDGGTPMVRRVAAKRVDGDTELVFYSDNSRDFPPRTYLLQRDFGGDLRRAVLGRVVWSGCDMTKK